MTYETPQVLIDLIERVIDCGGNRHSNGDETFIECLVCGEWEGHTDDCPIPALDRWMAQPGINKGEPTMASFVMREIDDALWRKVKSKAAAEGISLKDLALQLFSEYAKAPRSK
jgi:hypothetical protein